MDHVWTQPPKLDPPPSPQSYKLSLLGSPDRTCHHNQN